MLGELQNNCSHFPVHTLLFSPHLPYRVYLCSSMFRSLSCHLSTSGQFLDFPLTLSTACFYFFLSSSNNSKKEFTHIISFNCCIQPIIGCACTLLNDTYVKFPLELFLCFFIFFSVRLFETSPFRCL